MDAPAWTDSSSAHESVPAQPLHPATPTAPQPVMPDWEPSPPRREPGYMPYTYYSDQPILERRRPEQMIRANGGARTSGFCLFIGAVIIAFTIYAVFFRREHLFDARVDAATLNEFALSDGSGGSLAYALTLDISLQNSDSQTTLFFYYIEASLIYGGAVLGNAGSGIPVQLYVYPKTSAALRPVFWGTANGVGAAVREAYAREAAEGLFGMEVKIKAALRYRVVDSSTQEVKVLDALPTMDCLARVPVSLRNSAGDGGGGRFSFSGVNCNVTY